jgi:glycosyltransferase involved in cell wall biosynthesis
VDVDRLIVLAPIEPARTGNGLAMRAELFRRAAPPSVAVTTVVVPVAGRLATRQAPAAGVRHVSLDAAVARAGMRSLVGEVAWRARLERVGHLPVRARAASAGLAEPVVRACGDRDRVALHVIRSYLAPLGVAVAERLNPAWLTLDLDDDDAAVAASHGDHNEAGAYERLIDVFGPLFDGLCAASLPEAEAISARHELTVEHVPNAVDIPDPAEHASRSSGASLLFVGNLTYAPNVEAAHTLVESILPRVQRRVGGSVEMTLAGAHHPALKRLARPGVTVAGFVPDLRPLYAGADVVVVPLATGGGTRIKLLEAFAHGVPVVASPAAAAGLEVSDERHLLLAADPEQVAAAVEAILARPELAADLRRHALRLVQERYATDVVAPRVREFFARASTRATARAQLSAAP